MAYPASRLTAQTYVQDADYTPDWTLSSGTDSVALLDDPWDSPNDSDFIDSATLNDEVRFHYTWDRNPYDFEFYVIVLRAKSNATGVCNIDFVVDGVPLNAIGIDISGATSYTNFFIPMRLSGSGHTFNQVDKQVPDFTDGQGSAVHLRVRSGVTGGGQVYISNLALLSYPLADWQKLAPDGNGATNNWTASTGSNYQCVDNPGDITTEADWADHFDDTTDYVGSSTSGHVDIYDIETPTYSDYGGGNFDFVQIWAYNWQATGTGDSSTALTADLIESGTAFTSDVTVDFGQYMRCEDNTPGRFNSVTRKVDSVPTSWAASQLKITQNWASKEIRIYWLAVIGPFGYAAATNYDVAITEAITVGDTQAGIMATFQAIAESITVGDTQAGLAGSFGTFAEGITVGDAQSALAAALGSVSESVLLTDLVTGIQAYLVSISEGITVGDTQSAVASALAALSESITVGDTQTALAGALAALTEGVVTGDTQSGLATALAILAAENVNLNEVLIGLQLFLAAITEGITVGDSVSAEAGALAAFAESLAAGDAPSATATALAALSEGITNAEVFAAVAAAYASVNEGILVGETWSYPLIGAHLVGTFSIEPLLAASPSNQPLLAATVTTEGLEGVTITINR